MKKLIRTFGWQHFSFDIPSDWDLVLEQGYEKKGHIQLNDENGPRMEFRWESFPKKMTLLDFVVAHSKKIGWLSSPMKALNDQKTFFSLENNVDGVQQFVLFFYDPSLPKCRLGVFRLFFTQKENPFKVIKKIVNSFSDSLFQEKSLWSYYDLNYHLPSQYRKVKGEIGVGTKYLLFENRHQMVHIWSLSLISHFTNDLSLETWYNQFLKKEIGKQIKLKIKSIPLNQTIDEKTSFLGRLLYRNLFHRAHHWKIMSSYNSRLDNLRIAIIRTRGQKEFSKFSNLNELIHGTF